MTNEERKALLLRCNVCEQKATIEEEVFFIVVGHLRSGDDSREGVDHHVCKKCMGERLGRQESKESRSDPIYLREEQVLEEQDYLRNKEE